MTKRISLPDLCLSLSTEAPDAAIGETDLGDQAGQGRSSVDTSGSVEERRIVIFPQMIKVTA